jgi:peptidoglycan/xylan/chitin deacetylase (PgdA/CDA1 family)
MRCVFFPVVALIGLAGLTGCATPPENRGALTEPQVQVASAEADTSTFSGASGVFGRRNDLEGRDLWIGSAADLDLRPGEIILTFDDGPSPTQTPRILATLEEFGVHAVFFMVGDMAGRHPETAQAVALAGHTIGTHSSGHGNLARLSLATALDNVGEGELAVAEALRPVFRSPAPFFRFPYLAETRALRASLVANGLVIFDVDVDSLDYQRESARQVLARTLRRLDQQGRGIVLFHDIHGRTAELLPDFLSALQERGFKVVRARSPLRSLFDTPLLTASR